MKGLKGMEWERQVQVRQAKLEEEIVLPQGLGRNVDAQVLPTNLEDEVGREQCLARVVEVEARLTDLDDELGQVDDNSIREDQTEQHMVEEVDTKSR